MNIGIIGDGQLGRMLALSGISYGFNFAFLGSYNSPAAAVGKIFTNITELENFADVITFESENTNFNLLQNISKPIFPDINALYLTQHRVREKELFNKLSITCAKYKLVDNINNLKDAIKEIGLPCIIKTTTNGYDGKGQFIIRDNEQIKTAILLYAQTSEIIVEEIINFDYEISIIAVRANNDTKYYQITKNTHKSSILQFSEFININPNLIKKAKKYINLVLNYFNYKGVLTIEFFVVGDKLIANEIAPRVHNSGHWSIDGAKTSQFANHIRAIANMPLGSTDAIYKHCKMVNLIGNDIDITKILKINNAYLHLYAKDSRPQRKIGHINICDNDAVKIEKSIKTINAVI